LKYRFLLLAVVMLSTSVRAWDGYDWDKGTSVEIESGNLVRSGEQIEFYDWDKGEYRTGEVQSVDRYGSSVDVEIIDDDSGETRTFEMDDE
jgi:hypothetical protein